ARAAGSLADVKITYTDLSQGQPPEVQLALKRNPEAVKLVRDAENQQKVDNWLKDKDLNSRDGVDTVMKGLKGEDGDLGQLDESAKKYLLDKVLSRYEKDDASWNIDYLAEASGRSGDPALRSLVSERMAARVADLAAPASGKEPSH